MKCGEFQRRDIKGGGGKKRKEKKIVVQIFRLTCEKRKSNVSFALQSLLSLQPYLVLDTEKVERYYCAAG